MYIYERHIWATMYTYDMYIYIYDVYMFTCIRTYIKNMYQGIQGAYQGMTYICVIPWYVHIYVSYLVYMCDMYIHMCHTLICTYICVIRCIYVSYAHTYASYLDRLSSSNDNLDAIDGLTSYYAAQLLPRRMLLRAPALQPQTDAPSFFPPFPCRKIWHHSRAATSAADLLSHLWFPTPSETCRPGCRRHAARPRTRAAGGHARAVAVEARRTWRGAWRSVGSR